MFDNKRGRLLLASRLSTVVKSISGGVVFALLAGVGLLFNVVKNIIAPPQQTSPPLWVILLAGALIIIIMKKK